MRRLVAAMVVLTLVAGCGPRVQIVRDPYELEEMNRALTDVRATLRMRDGELVACDHLLVASDSTTWVDRQSGERCTASTSSLVSVKVARPGQGSVVGCLIGGLGGLVAAAAGSASDHSGLGFVFGPAVGGLVGLAVGARATFDEYRLELSQKSLGRSEASERSK